MKPTTLLHAARGQDGRGIAFFLLWEPRDLWLGLYWDLRDAEYGAKRLDLYLCFVPLLPIRLAIHWTPNASLTGGYAAQEPNRDK